MRIGEALWRMCGRAFGVSVAFVILAGSALAQDKIVITTDWAPHGAHAGLHLAVQKGWFKEAGLYVEVQDGRGSGNTIQLVAANKIGLGFAQLGAMAPAIAGGLPVAMVFMSR